jgi:hypothetical protein
MVCEASKDVWEAVNEALWVGRVPNMGNRVYGGVTGAMAVMAASKHPCSKGVIVRHQTHIEKSAREADDRRPQTTRERAIYATDFVSVTERMTKMGMAAADRIAERMESGEMDDRTLVSVAQMGLKASVDREKASRATKDMGIDIRVVFGVSGGFAKGEDAPYRRIDGDEADLLAQVAAKRERLKELSAG